MSSRAWLVLPAMALALGGQVARAGAGDAHEALRAVVEGVEARRGVQYRHLVVVALVLPEPCDRTGPLFSTGDLSWADDAGERIRLDATQAGEDRLLPTGLLLGAGEAERVLAMPAPIAAGSVGEGEAIPLSGAPNVPEGATRAFKGLAGPEVRHVVTIAPDPDALADLLVLERRIAGLVGPDVSGGFLDVRSGAHIAPEVQAGAKALAPLPESYGGLIRGHVAFLGEQAVEVVWAGTGPLYEALARESVGGLAAYAALWEEAFGRAGWPAEALPWPRALEEASALLRQMAKASVRSVGSDRRWRLRMKGASRLGWLLLDDQEAPLLLEAWPLGDEGPFPVPRRGPGGPSSGDRPDDILGGAMTRKFLERYLKRLEEIRRRRRLK